MWAIVLALVLFVLYNYREGYQNRQCSYYSNCASCVANYNAGDPRTPCWWSNDKDRYGKTKGCSAFFDVGFSRTCSGPSPTSCPSNTSCSDCVNSDCYWGDNKCSYFKFDGYNSVCADCPTYTMINVPTYVKTAKTTYVS